MEEKKKRKSCSCKVCIELVWDDRFEKVRDLRMVFWKIILFYVLMGYFGYFVEGEELDECVGF